MYYYTLFAISMSLLVVSGEGIKLGFLEEEFKSMLWEAWRNQVPFLSCAIIFL